MKSVLGALAAAAALGAAAGCATVGPPVDAAQVEYPTAEIASLERALADAPEGDDLSKLLLSRGHAYLLEGENWLKAHPDGGERQRGYAGYAGHFLKAINDFETIVAAHADSPEAAEAMFHLGVVHDSPNLNNLFLAIDYYRRTMEEHPGTEWAENARRSLANIREQFHHVFRESHGL